MNTKKSRLIIPGINIKTLKQLATYDLPIGICMGYTALLLVWRTQITLAMQPILEDAKAVQGLESQKLTASRLANNQWTRWLLAFNAISETLALSAKDLIGEDGKSKPHDEIASTLIGLATELSTAPLEGSKPGKVLPDSSVTEETADIHRRGLIGRLRGIWQTRAIFSPNEIVQGANAALMSARDLIPLLDDLYETTQIPLNLEGWEIPQIADIADWDENWSPGKKIVEIFLADPEFQNVILPDGIKLGSKTNSLPFEEEMGASRTLPEVREEVEIPKNVDPQN